MKDCLKISHFILSCYIILAESWGVGGFILGLVEKILQPRLKNGTFYLSFLHLIQIGCGEGWCTTKYRLAALGLQFVTSRINERGSVKGSMRGDGKDERGKAPFHFPPFHQLFSSSRLALRTRFALRAKCRFRLAWLIKRLLCRLRHNGKRQ